MEPSFELFDHTADVGVRVRAPTPAGLLQAATDGLYAVIGEIVGAEVTREVLLDLQGAGLAELLRDYLAEILYFFEQGHERLTALRVLRYDAEVLSAVCTLCAVDAQRSVYNREVKAVTYHELAVEPCNGGYEAVFILDI